MAIVHSTAIGKAKGSIGGVVFSTQKGRVIARERNSNPANPDTDAQRVQRGYMREMVKAYKLIGRSQFQGLTASGKYQSAYNAFISANIKRAESILAHLTNGGSHTYEALILSNGSLTSPVYEGEIMGRVVNFSTQLPDDVASDLKAGDKMVCVAYNPTTHEVATVETVLDLNTLFGSHDYSVEMKTTIYNGEVMVAAYIVSADGSNSSKAELISARQRA